MAIKIQKETSGHFENETAHVTFDQQYLAFCFNPHR